MFSSTRLIVLVAVIALHMGCDGPCRALAEQVCQCEPSARERNACNVKLDQADSRDDPTPEEEALCSELLDTCTCDALAQDNLAACGLTNGSPP